MHRVAVGGEIPGIQNRIMIAQKIQPKIFEPENTYFTKRVNTNSKMKRGMI